MAVSSERELESLAELFRSLGHPVRLRIVLALETETLSPSELAQRLRVGLGVLAYHVRALRDDGLVELTEQRIARGSLESFYRLSARGQWARDILVAVCGERPDLAEPRSRATP